MSQAIAFLGLGLMGSPMVRRLRRAGLPVRVWNRTPAKAVPLVEDGAELASTPVEAVAGASIVCLCLTDAAAVEAVLFGSSGAAKALEPGAVVVDFSTIGPGPTRRLAARTAAAARGARWVDAPVSGGVTGAELGRLVILCGGDPRDVEAVRPVLDHLAQGVRHLGPLGAGQSAKLCNQLIVAVNVVAVAEALALARTHGLEPAALPGALVGGWADSLPLQIIGPRMAAEVTEPPIVAVGTFGKDLGLVLAEARSPLAMAARAEAIYRAAADAGLATADATALLRFVEEASPRGRE
jgi:3-hydroxyisobutyrate dehydrogenase/2-hydroxy-3-oxopropionate reductase